MHAKKAVTSSDWVKRVRSSYLFGMLMPGRHDELSGRTYAYGFQGQERDDEVKGAGNAINFKFRMHDPRLGRWLSVDPLQAKFPDVSPYNFAVNNPILLVDPNGKEPRWGQLGTISQIKGEMQITLTAAKVQQGSLSQQFEALSTHFSANRKHERVNG